MPIKEFELLHGAVLAKLARKERPLRLFETEKDKWAVYTVDDVVEIFIKRSMNPNPDADEKSWSFAFNKNEIEKIRRLKLPVAIALVCGRENISSKPNERMFLCFIKPQFLSKVIDLDNDVTKNLRVTYKKGERKLKIIHNRKMVHDEFLNAIMDDDWLK